MYHFHFNTTVMVIYTFISLSQINLMGLLSIQYPLCHYMTCKHKGYIYVQIVLLQFHDFQLEVGKILCVVFDERNIVKR